MMDNNLQPSFIPKKSLNQSLEKPKGSLNIISALTTTLFVVVVLMAGAVFGFGMYFNKQLSQKQVVLQTELDTFQQSVIDDIFRVDSKIESAKTLLQNHVSVSALLSAIGNATLRTVRFSNFNYNTNLGSDITISMNGQAKNFTSVALQQVEFSKPENKKYFKEPILADFSLDKEGNVTFSFSAKVDPKYLIVGSNSQTVRDDSSQTLPASAPEVSTSTATSTIPRTPRSN